MEEVGGMEMITVLIIVGSILLTLVITGVSVFFALKMMRGFQNTMQQANQLMQTGQPAQARIVSVQDLGGSIRIGGQMPQHRLTIQLEVMPPGGAPYPATATQLVSMLHVARLQPGATVQVRYDRMEPTKVIVVL